MRVKLSEAFDLQMGKTPSRNNSDYWGPGYKWVSIADIGGAEKYISKTKETITDIAVSESGIKVVPKNTVIMSFKLSIGKTAITAEDMYTNEAIIAFLDRGTFNIDTNYLYHLCKSINWFDGTNKAVLGLTLNKATLAQKEIELPSITEQKEAVTILDKVDDLISLRKQQLAKLDELVKARFVEMFGDAEQNEKDLPTLPMTELCEIIDGDRGKNYPKQEEFSEEGFCLFLNAKNVTSNGFSFENCMYITEEKDKILRNGKLSRGDVVLTTRGTLGNLAFYDEAVPYEHMRINSGMVILRMKRDRIAERFFIEQFKMQLVSIKERIASGSAQPQLPISTMNKIVMLAPDVELQKQFAFFVEQTDKSKAAIQESLDKLETLKKALMQKYFG